MELRKIIVKCCHVSRITGTIDNVEKHRVLSWREARDFCSNVYEDWTPEMGEKLERDGFVNVDRTNLVRTDAFYS